MKNIYFLGGGKMATAIIASLVKLDGWQITVVEKNTEQRTVLEQQFSIATVQRLPELSANDVLVLAVKPQDLQLACQDCHINGALVLSIVAGIPVALLQQWLGNHSRIVRIMPNTPAQVKLGVSGLFATNSISDEDKSTATHIMQQVGQVIWLNEENQINDITAISGSGPAYVFYLLEALQYSAQQLGFDEVIARELSLNTFQGACELARQSGVDFATLRQNVTSKGGTTFEAIKVFQEQHLSEIIDNGVKACQHRAIELSEELGK